MRRVTHGSDTTPRKASASLGAAPNRASERHLVLQLTKRRVILEIERTSHCLAVDVHKLHSVDFKVRLQSDEKHRRNAKEIDAFQDSPQRITRRNAVGQIPDVAAAIPNRRAARRHGRRLVRSGQRHKTKSRPQPPTDAGGKLAIEDPTNPQSDPRFLHAGLRKCRHNDLRDVS